jgi:hypothetical protein
MPSMDTVETRFGWALEDGLVILAIALAWVGLAIAVGLVLALFGELFELVGGYPGPLLSMLFRGSVTNALFGQLALANVLLYVLVRAGKRVVEAYSSRPVGA